MPPKKARESLVSNGGEEGTESTPAKQSKDGLSVEDLSLPKSMIARLAKGVLPANTQIQKDALLALHKSATVFVSYIASNAWDVAQSNQKRTVHPMDVTAALKECEFEDFLPRLDAELKKFTETQNDKRNNYRRKVKDQQKAAASVDKEGGDASMDVETTEGTNGTAVNGEAASHDDIDRPTKKQKGDDGSAVAAETDEMDEDGDDVGQDGEVDDVDDAEDDVDDDGGDDEDEADDGDEVDDDDEGMEGAEADGDSRLTNMRDEALDDPGSDSD